MLKVKQKICFPMRPLVIAQSCVGGYLKQPFKMEAFLLGMILRVWKRRLKKHYLTMLRLKTLHQRIKTTLWNPLVANMILKSSKLSRLSIWWTKSRRRNMIYPLLKFRTLIKSTKNFTPNIKSNKIMLNKTRQEELWEKETRIRP